MTKIIEVIEGPADIGNIFGYFRPGLLPAGKFAIVDTCEFINGGCGVRTVDGKLYGSRDAAEAKASVLRLA